MTQPTVVAEVVTFVDAEGNITDDSATAVRGEVVESMSDGTTRTTQFTIDPSAA